MFTETSSKGFAIVTYNSLRHLEEHIAFDFGMKLIKSVLPYIPVCILFSGLFGLNGSLKNIWLEFSSHIFLSFTFLILGLTIGVFSTPDPETIQEKLKIKIKNYLDIKSSGTIESTNNDILSLKEDSQNIEGKIIEIVNLRQEAFNISVSKLELLNLAPERREKELENKEAQVKAAIRTYHNELREKAIGIRSRILKTISASCHSNENIYSNPKSLNDLRCIVEDLSRIRGNL